MKLFYFELEFEGKLYDTKVIAAPTSWDAWVKFYDMVAATWDAEMTEMSIDNWRQVAYGSAQSTLYAGHHACPKALLMKINDPV